MAPSSREPRTRLRLDAVGPSVGPALGRRLAVRHHRHEGPRERGGLEKSGNAIEAPLHGVVSQLHVALGDTVEKGEPVLQMEAMKLIHTLRAPVSGRIGQIRCNVGDTVPAGAVLVEISPIEVEEKS